MKYLINKESDTGFLSGSGNKINIDKDIFARALLDCEAVIKKITYEIPVDIFAILGMRNLSAFIGELFVMSIVKESLHQKSPSRWLSRFAFNGRLWKTFIGQIKKSRETS